MISRRTQRAVWASRLRGETAMTTAVNLRVGRVEFEGVSRSSAQRITDSFETHLGEALSVGQNLMPTAGSQASWGRSQKLEELHGSVPRGLRERERGEHVARAVVEILREVRR